MATKILSLAGIVVGALPGDCKVLGDNGVLAETIVPFGKGWTVNWPED
jgi:hypothetical protein